MFLKVTKNLLNFLKSFIEMTNILTCNVNLALLKGNKLFLYLKKNNKENNFAVVKLLHNNTFKK